jgi:hypothetical protein
MIARWRCVFKAEPSNSPAMIMSARGVPVFNEKGPYP